MSTIAAISTALGTSGVNIIRISGNESLNVVGKIFTNHEKLSPNTIIYGRIKDKEEFVDNVLVSYFKSPNSFTGEDVCEINCHGGTYVTKRILELILSFGVEIATPGEFSKRAFLNGKMDLSEAEAIIDLINAKTKIESRIATNQLEGKLYKKIVELREKMIDILAHIEVSVDYPEYDYEEIDNTNLINLLNYEIFELEKLIKTYEEGKYIKNGINVAILGKPNVGKSSLLNTLAKYERAIVTNIAGTTRDVVEEIINIDDIIINISDTAGIRETEDLVEKIGVKKSLNKIDEVDLVIYILDCNDDSIKDDIATLSKIENKGVKYIVVINKMDEIEKSLKSAFMEELNVNGIKEYIYMSINNNRGIDELKNKIKEMFMKDIISNSNELIIVNERHKFLLSNSIDKLKNALKEVNNNMPVDIISIEIKESAKKLGEIIGTDVSKDIVTKIFENFCLGK